ncbi:hypothetical protein GGH96_003652 [Coemansia sp. RSA 1972]|nr:hypothetical protein GGH96_003652 [Coemansia sp. RSA 1972]
MHKVLLSKDNFHASLLQTAEHIYPLRERSERNLHPYTKLVWTDPAELHTTRNVRHDLAGLDSQMRINQEDSEDEDYVPGSPELAEEASQLASLELSSSQPQLIQPQRRLTYGHMAARRRQRMSDSRRIKHRLFRDQSDSDVLPSVNSILAPRANGSDQPEDPYAYPASDDQHHIERTRLSPTLSSSSLDDPSEVLGGTLQRNKDLLADGVAGGSDTSHERQCKRRRLLSRRRRLEAEQNDKTSNAMPDNLSGNSSADQLPTARARRLEKLSRRQIRGVLPFSFMRDLDSGRNSEISEEVGRWQRQPSRSALARQRALSNSPPLATTSAVKRVDSDGDMPMTDAGWQSAGDSAPSHLSHAGNPADLFSDPVGPAEPVWSDRHQLRFAFNLMDIYEWQYPPLAPSELTGAAPDFLRIAARECRRRGIRAKSQPDDASRKVIAIAPRNSAEDDVAQSVLLAWRMGVIDVRRVYFDDESDESEAHRYGDINDGFEAHQRGGDISDESEAHQRGGDISEDDWPHSVDLAGGLALSGHSPITISDGEAVEDNGEFDRMSSAVRRRCRSKQPGARRKKPAEPGRSRAARPISTQLSLMRRPVSERTHATHANENRGLNAVMGEFAAFDSDSDTNSVQTNSRLPPPLLDRHMTHMHSKHTRQRQFVDRFNRQSKPQAQRLHRSRKSTASTYGRTAGARSSHARVAGRRHVPAQAAALRAEFVFDDQDTTAHASPAKPRLQQTRLLTNRHAGPGSGPSMADAVADRISKRRTTASSARSSTTSVMRSSTTAPTRNRASYSRGVHRKTVPTRVQISSTSRAPVAVAVAVALRSSADHPASDEENMPFGGRGSRSNEVGRLASGTRFMNSAWIAQGGIRQIRQRLDDTLVGPARAPEQNSYCYGDVLRIDASATPIEFGQALDMLFRLWNEKIVDASTVGDASVLRWIGFSQQYIAHRPRSSAALAQIAHVLVQGAHTAMTRLKALATGRNGDMALAACVGLSYAVNLLQLAVSLARARSSTGPAGPRAVGEDDDALTEVIGMADLGVEIDRAVVATVKLLSHAACNTTGLSGTSAQVWLTLIHVFTGSTNDNTSDRWISAVPVRGMWDAVHHVCTHGHVVDRRSRSVWAALELLVRLAQVNIDGVAAPRIALHLHGPLQRLAEVAAERQLHNINTESLRASDEVAVRQAYFRAHSVVVDHGLRVPASSPLFMTLYRFLESNKFRSLSIEPAPSLPRFFTRYTATIGAASSAADTCTVLWLRALNESLSRQLAQLQATNGAMHRRVLRDVRTTVSKMLPTRILTFAPQTPRAQLSTLANYYSVFLLFLHAVPSHVVRAVRLYTQFQALLRFRDSASQTARRVYFEAWAASACIVASRLRGALSACDVCGVVQRLVGHGLEVGGDVDDYHRALVMAVTGWADALCVVLAEARSQAECPQLWSLVDASLMYAHRVLTSKPLSRHPLTISLLVLELLRAAPMLDLLVWPTGTAHCPALVRIRDIFGIWQHSLVQQAEPAPDPILAIEAEPVVDTPVAQATEHDDSQGLDMLDSIEMLEAATAADAMEHQSALSLVNTSIAQEIHDRFVPTLRLHLMSTFASQSSSHTEPLEATVDLLARMVSVCVSSGLRTWDSLLDEHGRDTLHLIPNANGRRRVLVLFAVAAINAERMAGRSSERIDVLAADVWFACACDLRLTPYTQRLAAQLQWSNTLCGPFADCFAHVPVDRHLLDHHGILRHTDTASGSDQLSVFEHRAALSVACISCVLQNMSRALRVAHEEHAKSAQKHVFSAWIALLLATMRHIHRESEHTVHAVTDTRSLVSSMNERVTLLVRDSCAELFLPPNLVLPH